MGPGTPAGLAGLKAGDVITQIDDELIPDAAALDAFLAGTTPGQTIAVLVRRDPASAPQPQCCQVELSEHPLSIVQPEVNSDAAPPAAAPLSLLLSLESIGDKSVPRDREELAGLPSLRNGCWNAQPLEDGGAGPGVEFRRRLSPARLQEIGATGELEIVKRYRLVPTPAEEADNPDFKSYHLALEVELRNLGSADQVLSYRLEGPSGLPTEGWWYSNKTHPTRWSGAGARDVVWRTPESGHGLISCASIYDEAKKAEAEESGSGLAPVRRREPHAGGIRGSRCPVFHRGPAAAGSRKRSRGDVQAGPAIPAGEVGEKDKSLRTNGQRDVPAGQPAPDIPAGKSHTAAVPVFAGPKRPDLLAAYGLDACIDYGWFPWIAKPLSGILHFFERLPLVNYGLAIILLTVLVRRLHVPAQPQGGPNAADDAGTGRRR